MRKFINFIGKIILVLLACFILSIIFIYRAFLMAPYTIPYKGITPDFLLTLNQVGEFNLVLQDDYGSDDVLKRFNHDSNETLFLYVHTYSGGRIDDGIIQYNVGDFDCDSYKHFGFGNLAWDLGKCDEYYHYYYFDSASGILFITNGSRDDLDKAIKDYINQSKNYEN